MKPSQRTKNRLREHSLRRVVASDGTCLVATSLRVDHRLVERECGLFLCTDDDCDWVGWLPLDEVRELTSRSDNDTKESEQ